MTTIKIVIGKKSKVDERTALLESEIETLILKLEQAQNEANRLYGVGQEIEELRVSLESQLELALEEGARLDERLVALDNLGILSPDTLRNCAS